MAFVRSGTGRGPRGDTVCPVIWRRRALSLETCEDRCTPSASLAVAIPTTISDRLLISPTVSVQAPAIASPGSIRNELVFIDAAVPDYQSLVQDLLTNTDSGRHFDVVVLSAR